MAFGFTNYAAGTTNPWSGGTIPQGAKVYSANGVNVQDYSGADPYQAAIAQGMTWRRPQDLAAGWQGAGNAAGTGAAASPATPESNITGLYQTYLGRTPDAGGMDFYKNQLASGMSISDLANEFTHSPEYMARQGQMSASSGNGGYSFSSNPYLPDQANAMRAQQSQLFNDMNQQIRGGSIATGGYGGSRMGVAQGVAMGRAATGLDSALAGMFGNAYEGDQNRGLQQYGMDQNFYTQQRGQDLQQQMDAATMYGLAQQGQWTPLQNWANVMSPFSGNGTTTSSQGGGAQGAVGGALSTWALMNMMNRG